MFVSTDFKWFFEVHTYGLMKKTIPVLGLIAKHLCELMQGPECEHLEWAEKQHFYPPRS
jgi:hypothetical protein